MNRPARAVLCDAATSCCIAAMLVTLAGCPAGNPQQLWIAENGSEAMLKLDDTQPDPF